MYEKMKNKLSDDKMGNLHRYVDAYEYLAEAHPFGPMQIQFEFRARTAFLSMFFKDHASEYLNELRDMGFPVDDNHYTNLVLMFPRRMGKTTIEAALSAIVAVSQVKGNVLSFHLGSRQAKMWLERVKEFLAFFKDSPRFSWTMKQQDIREYVYIEAHAVGCVNYVQALPGVHQGSSKIDMMSTEILFAAHLSFYSFRTLFHIRSTPLSLSLSPSLSFSFALSLSLSLSLSSGTWTTTMEPLNGYL